MSRQRYEAEDGASLMMVIIFVLIFGVVISAILNFAGTGFRTTKSVASVRDEQHAVDGAVEGAINAIRGSTTSGLQVGQACAPNFVYEGSDVGDEDVVVECTAVQSSNTADPDTMPEYAVLTLSDDECEGFLQEGMTPNIENRLTVRGGMFSNGRIAVGEEDQNTNCGSSQNDPGPPLMTVIGDVFAVQGCTPWNATDDRPSRIGMTGVFDCDAPTPEADPMYDPVVNSINGLVVDPTVTCASGNSVVVFSPGVYSEHPREHALRGTRNGVPNAGCDENGNEVWWFQPGVYYFDLPEADSLWDLHEASNIKNIVGGTLRTGLSASSNSSAFTFPGACVTEDAAGAEQPGVQFIFGGTTRMQTQSSNNATSQGDIELCGSSVTSVPVPGGVTRTTEKQRIVVYGVRDDQDVRTAQEDLIPAGSVTQTTGTWLNPTASLAASGAANNVTDYASAALVGRAQETASLTFSDFADIPEGSVVTAVYVRARHMESGSDADKVEPKIQIKIGNAAPQDVATLDRRSSFDSVNGFETGTDPDDYPEISGMLATRFRYDDLNSLSLIYTADGSALDQASGQACTGTGQNRVCPAETAEARLDALVIDVRYIPPGFNAQSCPSSQAGCTHPTFLTTTNNPRTIFNGTVYTPKAKLDVSLQNGSDQLFNRGVIAWDIVADVSPSNQQTASPFQLPGFEARRVVLLEASVGSPGCQPVTDRCRLRAKVSFSDDDATIGREVEVIDWAFLR